MLPRGPRLTLALVVLAITLYAGARRIGPVPALGNFLEPYNGVWGLTRTASLPEDAEVTVPGMGGDVRVLYDDRAVPHIFASTEADAYRALGYVVARDRLFQLYIQSMAASGRITELAGARALALDREMRGLGLPRAAERSAKAHANDGQVATLAQAYADGVNAYVDQLSPHDLPLEFRLTQTKPHRFTMLDSYYLFARMGYTLAYLAAENDRMAAASRVGSAAAAAIFPDASPIQEPIQPNGQHAPRFDFTSIPAPGAPDSNASLVTAAADAFLPSHRDAKQDADDRPTFASNNWAVSPKHSANGHALLAGDPHLELTLPSIWYEAHLTVPGVLDVYGVTIPGAPGILIGFTRDVAWTFTNTGADVLDYYVEQVDDANHPARYKLDGAWKPLEARVERYLGKNGETVATDTVYYTHRGPMKKVRGRWLSLRWTVLETGTEPAGFFAASHARTAAELEDAMAQWYRAPAQNMLAADRSGHIAIRSTGRYPIRPGDGSGAELRDGSVSSSDWRADLPVAQYPQSQDPEQGYLASANQQPIDPRVATGYWGGSYDPWRALRINELLRADSFVTTERMRAFQTDPGSARADLFVPSFLLAAQNVIARGGNSRDLSRLKEARVLLAQWDRRYTRDNRRAVLFEEAMRELVARTWDELATSPTKPRDRVATPSTAVLAELLSDSSNAWWDDRSTPQVEHRDDILAASLVAALDSVTARSGKPSGDGWRWDHVRFANINHLLHLPGISALNLPMQGGPGTLNPSAGSGVHGSSWRMVVDLGPEVRAWGTYPGGQSGNPASARYRDRLPSWMSGNLEPIRFPRTPEALPERQRSARLTLHPAR